MVSAISGFFNFFISNLALISGTSSLLRLSYSSGWFSNELFGWSWLFLEGVSSWELVLLGFFILSTNFYNSSSSIFYKNSWFTLLKTFSFFFGFVLFKTSNLYIYMSAKNGGLDVPQISGFIIVYLFLT